MNDTKKPVTRLTAESILRSFQISDKKHLFLTGGRGMGKSTLAKALVRIISDTTAEKRPFLPGITTSVVPGKHVLLTENGTNRSTVIGTFFSSESEPDCSETIGTGVSEYSQDSAHINKDLPAQGNRMRPVTEGFFSLGLPALTRAAADKSDWVSIDELGYLETACREFQDAVYALLAKKHVLAVIRKQDTPFLTDLIHRGDAFVIDLDAPVAPIGCVIMASGLSKRFGSNKLLADFHGKPLISHALIITGSNSHPEQEFSRSKSEFHTDPAHLCAVQASDPFSDRLLACRVVVTRTPEIQAVCRSENVPVLLHDFPNRSDTVRLGIQALSGSLSKNVHIDAFLPDEFSTFDKQLLAGYMFCPGDQPLISRESMEVLCLTFSQNPDRICRLGTKESPGAPVIFPARLSKELLTLPQGKGGSFLAKKYPEQVLYVPVRDDFELLDADTPETLAMLSHFSDRKVKHNSDDR